MIALRSSTILSFARGLAPPFVEEQQFRADVYVAKPRTVRAAREYSDRIEQFVRHWFDTKGNLRHPESTREQRESFAQCITSLTPVVSHG